MVHQYTYGATIPIYVYGGTIYICATICLWLSICTPASALMCRAMCGIRILSCAICVLDPQGANMYIVLINLDTICILFQACNHIYMVAHNMYMVAHNMYIVQGGKPHTCYCKNMYIVGHMYMAANIYLAQ
jgi:hypothetical protein